MAEIKTEETSRINNFLLMWVKSKPVAENSPHNDVLSQLLMFENKCTHEKEKNSVFNISFF